MAKYYLFILIAIVLCVRLLGQTQPPPDTNKTLNDVVVVYQADWRTPVTFQNLNSGYIKVRTTGQEPSFLLSETPSITAYSDAGNTQGYSYFRLRGIDQTRINITLDSVPLNEPEDQGAYFSNYADLFNSVSTVQIQRGVGTSKNGVASYGGSILLFSPNLYDSSKTTLGFGYGSFNSLRMFGEYNSGIRNRKAFHVRSSQVYSNGYKYNSSNNAQSVFFSSGLFFDKSIWKLNFIVGQQQNQLAWLGVSDSLILIDRKTNANSNEKDRFIQLLIQLQNNRRIGKFSTLQSSMYYTYLKGNYDFNLNNFIGLPTTAELLNYAFQSNLLGFFSNYTFSKGRFTLITGFHGNVYVRQHIGSETFQGQLYNNAGYKNEINFFTKLDYSIRKLLFFLDIQYRYANFNYRGSVPLSEMKWHFFNPKVGMSIKLKANAVLYYSVGSMGREPTRNDIFAGNDDLLTDSLGNPLVAITTPEYVVNHEFGFRLNTSKLSLSANAYYMAFANEIVLNGKFGPNAIALTNKAEKSFRTGVELSVDCKAGNHFTLRHNSSFNYSRIREQAVEFSPILSPLIIVNQEAVYSYKLLKIAFSARYQGRSFIDFSNTAYIDSYFLLNSWVSLDIKGISIMLFVNNITNANYYNNGYVEIDGTRKYFVQSPLNYYVSLKYSF